MTWIGRAQERIHPNDPDEDGLRRTRRRTLIALVTALGVTACSGPQVPLSVGLADRPVDLLLGERASAVAGAPVPPVAIPPVLLPDFDLPLPVAVPADDFTVTPPTYAFPSFATTTTTLPAGCTATPPTRTFNDSPDNITLPPLPTPEGQAGYVTRTAGKIEVDSDTVASTILPVLTKRRIENIQILERFPTAAAASNQSIMYADKWNYAYGGPSEFTFDVVADVGKPENNTRTTYRVKPGWTVGTASDRYAAGADGKIIGQFPDGKLDDFFTDYNRSGTVDAIDMFFDNSRNGTIEQIEQYYDLNNSNTIETGLSTWAQTTYPNGPAWGPGVTIRKPDNTTVAWTPDGPYGSLGVTGQAFRDERYQDITGDGLIGGWVTDTTTGAINWVNSALVVDTNNDGVPDRSETNFPNQRYRYGSDDRYDFNSYPAVNKGGVYLVSMQTGTKEANKITFTKVKDGSGALVDAPGALIAELPFVESATINTEAFTADASMSIKFETTVFGRGDVDVCRTSLVGWKVALDRGFIASRSQAMDFTAEYSFASQHGGVILEDRSIVTSIQAGSPTVKRTIESVFTTEPAAGVDPDPRCTKAAYDRCIH